MQKRLVSRRKVIAIITADFAVVLASVLLVQSLQKTTPPAALFDTEQYYRAVEEQPGPAPAPAKPEPAAHSENEPPLAAVPVDVDHETAPVVIITSAPARVQIPALSLDYPVQDTGADEKGTMQVAPALEVVSWFRLSSIPGNPGNAIFGGHNTWGGTRSRMFDLDQLEIGDEMIVFYKDGTSIKFCLESVFVYLLRTAPANLIMDVRGEARVTLITCKWPFNTVTGTSDYRIVAVFKEASTFVVPDPPVEPFPPRVLET